MKIGKSLLPTVPSFKLDINNIDSHDNGGRSIFDNRCGEVVTHHPKDKLDGLSISRSPDQVIGLLPTASLKPYISGVASKMLRGPFKDEKLLYPFLVIEAKRENGPGFRSVENQTAFPLRRLLKLQDDLQIASGWKFNPLVWFFAYQGEEWRLYAGIIRDSVVVSQRCSIVSLHLFCGT
jgi:hypothetical protein